jgi:hypothetical protein
MNTSRNTRPTYSLPQVNGKISKRTADALTMHESVDFRSTGGFGLANSKKSFPATSRKNLHNRTFITTIG